MLVESIPSPPSFSQPALLAADTDSTQTYVFESNKLPQIRGASRQLDRLNQEIGHLVENQGGYLVYAAGGSLLALIDLAQKEHLKLPHTIEEMYPLETGTATISAAYRRLPVDYQREFGKYVVWAGHWLRSHKESKAAPPFYETLPFQTVCASCQLRPANAALLQTNRPPRCSICDKKQQEGNKYDNDSWYGRFLTWLEKQENSASKQSYFKDVPNPDSAIIPHTVDEIGKASRGRKGYVGFVYLDGDGIGQLLTKLDTPQDYKQLSEALTKSTKDAVFAALAAELTPVLVEPSDARREDKETLVQSDQILIHPFDIITIGGDDVLLIVPADSALPITKRIGEAFGGSLTPVVQTLLNNPQATASMSAGVVLADDHTPVQMLFQLATDLLKKGAKKQGGALDFHLLKSVDMMDGNITNMREQYPYYIEKVGDNFQDLRLLGRPYTYTQFERLWQGLSELRKEKFPTSQMNLLASVLFEGRRQSTLFYQYQHERQKKAYEILEKLLVDLQGATSRDPLPWAAITGEAYSHQTVLWDIAELYDFVPQPDKKASGI